MVKSICIFEDHKCRQLNPLALTRPVFELRCGMLSLKEKIRRHFSNAALSLWCRDYLAATVRLANPGARVNESAREACLFINGRLLASDTLPGALDFSREFVLVDGKTIVAAFLSAEASSRMTPKSVLTAELAATFDAARPVENAVLIDYPWDLVNHNAAELARDFAVPGPAGSQAGDVHAAAVLVQPEDISIGAGARVRPGAVLDAEAGPIFLGEKVTIMPNAVIEGPVFIGAGSTIKAGARIYEGTSIGPRCKVGGEVEESIIHGFSNKQHDGFLGHSYLGQWVNLGADTNNSDLKNNYGSVKVAINGQKVDSGSLFAGLFMGDHSKTAINTMFNTGTVVGAMCNVFGSGFPPNDIPSFSWGGSDALRQHDPDRAIATARKVMARREVTMSPEEEALLRHIFALTAAERVQRDISS